MLCSFGESTERERERERGREGRRANPVAYGGSEGDEEMYISIHSCRARAQKGTHEVWISAGVGR